MLAFELIEKLLRRWRFAQQQSLPLDHRKIAGRKQFQPAQTLRQRCVHPQGRLAVEGGRIGE